MVSPDSRPAQARAAAPANRILVPLLRSRAHFLVSRRLMLLGYTGQRTGREYVIPVAYTRLGAAEVLVASQGTRWMSNLRDGRPVRLRLRGRELTAEPLITEGLEPVAALLREVAQRHGPGRLGPLRLGLPRGRAARPPELTAVAARTRLCRLRLTG